MRGTCQRHPETPSQPRASVNTNPCLQGAPAPPAVSLWLEARCLQIRVSCSRCGLRTYRAALSFFFFLGQHFLNPRPGAYSSLLVYQESWGQKRGAQDIPSLTLKRFWEMTKETQERAGDRRQKEHLCQLTPHSVRRSLPHMPLPTASTSWKAVSSVGTLWGLTNHQLPRSEGLQLSHAQTDLWGVPCKAQEGGGRDTAPACPPKPPKESSCVPICVAPGSILSQGLGAQSRLVTPPRVSTGDVSSVT